MPGWLILNIYSFILAVILVNLNRRKKYRTVQDRTFAALLNFVGFLLVFDCLSYLSAGDFPHAFELQQIGDFVTYACDPFSYFLGVAYITSWIQFEKPKRIRPFFIIAFAYAVFNFVMMLINTFGGTGWYYYFVGTTYHRGPLFMVRMVFGALYCVALSIYAFAYRKRIAQPGRKYVVAFPLIVMAGGVMQAFVPGASYEYAATLIACLLLFINVQNHNIYVDYLTGLLNRRGIDQKLADRMWSAERGKHFITYMVDMDRFKDINDDFGHNAGDEALQEMAAALLTVFNSKGDVGRYGGDEFLIVTDEENDAAIAKNIQTIQDALENSQKRRSVPYQLNFSVGYARYDAKVFPDSNAYFKYIDECMYAQKERHHRD